MNQAEYFSSIVSQSLSRVFLELMGFLPSLLAAIIVMIFGVLAARWSKWISIKLFKALGFKQLLKGSPVEKFLEKSETGFKPDQLIGSIVKGLVLLVFAIASVNILGLDSVSALLTDILQYIPTIFAAFIILIVGTLLAGLVESLVKGSVSSISVSTARLVSRIASYVVMIFAVLAAVAQLGIASQLIYILFIGIVAMLAVGFGLAFGLGAKDLVAKILDEWYTSLKKDNQ